jgi:phosphoribosyl 1,2-cyclic phosphate phosphodiesterase
VSGATLRVRLLGTGPSQGVPGIGEGWGACDPAEARNRRTRSACLIEAPDGTRLLVDAGPDIRAQLLDAGVDRLDAVLITHAHADHIAGLDEMRALNRAMGRALPLYAEAGTLEELHRRFDYCFRPATRGFYRPALVSHVVAPGGMLRVGSLAAELLGQDHRVTQSLGLRLGGFAYTTDVVEFPPESLARLQGLDTWVVGCFQRAPHPVHADLATVLAWRAALGPNRVILTHMGSTLDYGTLKAELPPGVEPGFDGMELGVAG